MAKKQDRRSRAQKEADELEKTYRGMFGKDRKKKKEKPEPGNRRKWIIAACIAVLVISLCTITAVYFYSGTGVILDNVSVAGVNVGGMKKSEAVRAVRAATKSTYSTTPMVVTVLESSVEIPAEYAGQLDVEGAVKAAYQVGRSGSAGKRAEDKKIAQTTGYVVDLSPYLSLNTDGISEKLSVLGDQYSSTLKQSSYQVLGDTPTAAQIEAGTDLQKLVVTLGVPEYGLDMDALYDLVVDAYSRNVFEVTGQCDTVMPDPIDLEKILSEYGVQAVDASFDSTTGKIVDGTFGYGFDLDATKQLLENAESGSVVEIPFVQLPPAITAQALMESMFKDTLATFTAYHNSSDDRTTNLILACKAINGIVLEPGAVFSYNGALGERTTDKGYRPGASYSGSETTYTVGGGICQISSCLYYCALQADLEIVSRDCHRFAPSYIPLGMDATVSWGSIDFRFRNNTAHPIRIEASATATTSTVTLQGIDDKDYYVEMEYEVTKEYPSVTTYKEMTADNAEGYKDGDYIVTPYKGYDVKTYRCKYNKETKARISRDYESTSHYSKRDAVICKIIDAPQDTPVSGGNGGISGNGGGISDSGSLPPE